MAAAFMLLLYIYCKTNKRRFNEKMISIFVIYKYECHVS